MLFCVSMCVCVCVCVHQLTVLCVSECMELFCVFVIVCVYVYVFHFNMFSVSELNVGRKEGNVLFNDALNTFYLRLRTILIVREETRCHHIGYSFRLAARVVLYAPSHR